MDNNFFLFLLLICWFNVLTFEKRAKACVLNSRWSKWGGVPVYKIGWFIYPLIFLLWFFSDSVLEEYKEILRWGISAGLFFSSTRQAWGLRWLDDPCRACLSGHFCNLLIILILVFRLV